MGILNGRRVVLSAWRASSSEGDLGSLGTF